MTSNIEKINAIATELIGMNVVVRECGAYRGSMRRIETGVCTSISIIWSDKGPDIEIVVDGLKTEIHHAKQQHVETISEEKWTDFRFNLSRMMYDEGYNVTDYGNRITFYFDEPARDYLSGNAVMTFSKR